jgi:hypothetical protein
VSADVRLCKDMLKSADDHRVWEEAAEARLETVRW